MPTPSPSSDVRRLRVALLGHGVVGSGVVKLLEQQAADLRQRCGLAFDVRHVVVRDAAKHRDSATGLPLTTDAAAAVTDPQVDVVIELMGGLSPAREHVLAALNAGKAVVTANKSLLAAHGPELFAAAKKNDTCLAFEASCGGGIPIVGALCNGLLANRIDALVGILNGTSNVILTQMTREGASYDDALAEAQRKGFAEADPTLDVSGRDAAQKLAILAGLAFGRGLSEKDVHVEGIVGIDPLDIRFAGELGYVFKLVAFASRDEDDRVSLRVSPGFLAKGDPMADVGGPFNAVGVYGHALGHATFVGRGAGQMPTASAVVADLVQVGLGVTGQAFRQLNIFPDNVPPADVLPFEETQSRSYLRLTARDVPGTLADVTRILGDAGISLSAVLQREVPEGQGGEFVPVVITTHLAREGSTRQAVEQLEKLPGIAAPVARYRIIDPPPEAID